MYPASEVHSQTLQEAFAAFSAVSEQLTDAYRHLEERVAQMTTELCAARTEREIQQQARARIENRFAHLMDALPVGVAVLDGAGRIQVVNPTAEEFLGVPLLGCPWIEAMQRAFDPRNDDGHEISLKDGRRISVCTRAMTPEPGQVLVFTDVTETRNLQERVARQQRLTAMGEMAAAIAHQIRTPLAAAMLYASTLQERIISSQETQRFSAKLLERLAHLEALVTDMLVFAKGGCVISEEVDVHELLAEYRQMAEPLVAARAGCVVVDMGMDMDVPVRVYGNRHALLGALLNLTTNGIEACPADRSPSIVVSITRTPDEHLVIAIKDNGKGIAPELMERIFEPFYTSRAGGTGLGLAVVRAVALSHQGAIALIESGSQGSVFAMTIPLINNRKKV